MSFCLKRLCYCVKSTALVATHLRARGYFDLNKKEEFSDSLAQRIFFFIIDFFLKARGVAPMYVTWSQRILAEALF